MQIGEMLEQASHRLKRTTPGLHVLAIQDTTEINYQAHADKTQGLGKVGNGSDVGFFLHPVIAVESQSHTLLGLCGAVVWQRFKAKAPQYKQLPIEVKESYRWLQGAQGAKKALSQAACITVIGDRESDIYEEWVRVPDERTHLLTRACRDRGLAGGSRLFAWSDTLAVQHRYCLELPARAGQPGRTAALELRFSPVTLNRPLAAHDKDLPPSCVLHLIDVREVHAPQQTSAIHWRLLTTHEVSSVEKALEVVGWYTQRWQVEQVFRTLKRQGLDVESSQVEQAQSLEKLVVLSLMAAVRTLQLVGDREGQLQRPAEDVFEAEEVVLLQHLQPRLEGKTEKQKNPYPRGSLAWGGWMIARLGGWKGYASERPPGPITMLNGLKTFSDLHEGWLLAKLVCMP